MIHDSWQNMFPIKDIFRMNIIYDKYFRQKVYHDVGVNFKYDLELCRTLRDHIDYRFNWETKHLKLKGYERDVKYILNTLKNYYDLKNESIDIDESTKVDDVLKSLLISVHFHWGWRFHHIFCNDPRVRADSTMTYEADVDYDFDNDPIIKDVLIHSKEFEIK